MNEKRKQPMINALGWLVFCFIIYFPIFQDIDRLPIQFWDESRNANNAFEMAHNGDFMVRHYNGSPDMWELNPPLLTWLQSISMKIFGFNELGLRFPTSLAVLSTIILMLHFFKKEFDTYWPAVFASFVLITSSGYMGAHIGRSGDHDAILTFMLTAASLSYYKHIKYFNNGSKYLTHTTLFLILAVYTKSTAGLFLLPSFFVYTIYKKKLKEIFSDYRSYLSFIIFIFFTSAYFVIREIKAPGSWDIFWNNGMLPRFTNSSNFEGHFDPGYWWYFKNLIEYRFTYWLPALFLPLLFKFQLKKANLWDFVLFTYTMPLVMLLILSIGTKHLWYDAPAYPFFAMNIGLGLFALINLGKEKIELNNWLKQALIAAFILGVFILPYKSMFDKVYKINEWDSRLYNGLYVKHLKKEGKSFYNYSMFFQGYNAPVEFYVKALNDDGKHNVKVLGDQIQHLKVFDTIMSCDWESYYILDSAFYLNTIDQFEHCRIYVVDSVKTYSD